MDRCCANNLSETKNEYTTLLVNIMTPFIYEGIRSVYQFALNAHAEFIESGKHDPTIKSPGILKIFQLSLREIPTLNNNSIENETNRIKSGSKCADWFDDLIKAVVKSHITLLIFPNKKNRSEILKEEQHNKIETKDFVHKCYIESARAIYNNPDLFWHEVHSLDAKSNQRKACKLIKLAIQEAIMKTLPIKLILKEYLQNNYFDDDISIPESNYITIQNMVKRDLYGLPDEVVNKGALETTSSSSTNAHTSESETVSNVDQKDDVKSEDLMESSHSKSSNSVDETAFLGQMETKLNEVEKEINQPPTNDQNDAILKELIAQQTITQPSTIPTQPINQSTQLPPVSAPVTIPIVSNPQTGGIPRAASDDEIKELLKRADIVKNLENPKKKPNRRELAMLKEIETQIKPKGDEPDRKLFFEQYMK